jgi:hypothetical protein
VSILREEKDGTPKVYQIEMADVDVLVIAG